MVNWCVVPFCKSSSRNSTETKTKYHGFPKEKKLFKAWTIKIKIKRKPPPCGKVCSRHFAESDYYLSLSGNTKKLKENAVPSLNLPHRSHSPTNLVEKNERSQRRADRIIKREAKLNLKLKGSNQKNFKEQHEYHSTSVAIDEKPHEIEFFDINKLVNEENVDIKIKEKHVESQTDNIQTNQQVTNKLVQTVHMAKQKSSLLENVSESKLLYLTGFTFNNFNLLWHALRNEKIGDLFDKIITRKDQLFLCLVRYKLNVDFMLLEILYGIDHKIISNIFKYWTNILYTHFKSIDWWNYRAIEYDRYTAIIDCAEFEIEQINLDENKKVCSNYTNGKTFKILFAIDEEEQVIFCSNVFEGTVGDQLIIQESGFCDLLEEGDAILADREIEIGDILTRKGVALNTILFNENIIELDENQTQASRDSVSNRIHAEHVIEMAKNNKELVQNIPDELWSIINKMVYVGSFLSNFKQSVV